MGLQINQYPIERIKFGDNDYLDIDYWDGTQYRSAKIKASHLFKVATTAHDYEDNQNKFILKNDAGEWIEAKSYEMLTSLFTSGAIDTFPNVVNHNFTSYNITMNGSYSQMYGEDMFYIDCDGTKIGTPLRMFDMGAVYAKLYGSQNNHFIEVDNTIMQGWTNGVFGTGDPIKLIAPNLVYMIAGVQFDQWLKQLVAPNLKYLKGIQIGTNGVILDFPSLEYIGRLDVYQGAQVFNMPNLKHVGNVYLSQINDATFAIDTAITFKNLQVSNNWCTSVSFANLEAVSNLSIGYNPSLNSINISSLKICTSTYVSFQNNALSQASVDAILWQFANMDGVTNGVNFIFQYATFYINGGANSAPSAYGLQAIAILGNRGVGVVTN